MSNPRKLDAFKKLEGTLKKSREVESIPLPTVAALPQPPEWLRNRHAIAEWYRLTPILFRVGVLTEAGTPALAVLCAVHGSIVSAFDGGEVPSAAELAQYRNLINDFGLTPVAQTKVKATKDPGEGANNVFTNHARLRERSN